MIGKNKNVSVEDRNKILLDKMVLGLLTLVKSVAGNAIPSESSNLSDAHVLTVKILKHVVTARYLMSSEMHFLGDAYPFVDHTSVAVLARTAIEGCLALHYTFCHSESETRSFRYKMWRYSGLLERSKVIVSTDSHKEKKESSVRQMENLKADLINSQSFKTLPKKLQKNVLEGNWRPQAPWINIAEEIGISRKLFHQHYDYFCGQCHSSFISVLQTRDAMNDPDKQAQLALMPSVFLAIILAHVVDAYRRVIPPAQSVFDANEEIRAWVGVAHNISSQMGRLMGD
ncbi:DUF5677 domain-containing protein [Achromobacter xylosoxidans]|uniref:DUF5677 domain-containing protein n=1 Tax=Alcaligenes xylosoxydans xylosoxydans TaxID=85698 RepID=UPI0012905B0A|nr:DUF5677 domain-containing protein [Achromobacter xylosoxidans]